MLALSLSGGGRSGGGGEWQVVETKWNRTRKSQPRSNRFRAFPGSYSGHNNYGGLLPLVERLKTLQLRAVQSTGQNRTHSTHLTRKLAVRKAGWDLLKTRNLGTVTLDFISVESTSAILEEKIQPGLALFVHCYQLRNPAVTR